jgi:hypothetical protein
MAKKLTLAEWVERARATHGDRYDYSRSVYTQAKSVIEIVCPVHGSFWQQAYDHAIGRGCDKCGRIQAGKTNSMSLDLLQAKLIAAHGLKYIYFFGEYRRNSHIKYVCPHHGIREQTLMWHLKSGCYACVLEKLEKRRKAKITYAELDEYVRLDRETGRLYLKKTDLLREKGQELTYFECGGGYLAVRVCRRQIKIHHVVWALANGRLLRQGMTIDHINGNITDNRPNNLREVSHHENTKNMTLHRNSTTGVAGVSYSTKHHKFVAYITHNRKRIHLGHYSTIEEASAARKAAEKEYGFHPFHGMSAEEKAKQ